MVHSSVNSRFKFESPDSTPSRNSLPFNSFHTLKIDLSRNSFIPNIFFTLRKNTGGVPYSSRFGTGRSPTLPNDHAQRPPEASLTVARTKPAETKLIVCVWHPFPQWRADEMMPAAIRKRWPEMRVVHLPDYDRLNEELPDTDIFVGASLRPDQFAFAKKLKWIHSTAAGVNQLMYPALKNSGVLVTNPSGLFSPGMAEHVIGMMVLLARNFMDSVRYQDKHIWAQNEVSSIPGEITELSGELMLIVGYGSIGREVARRASCFDMRIWGMTRSGKGDASLVDKILPISDLDAALPHADWVVLAAPDTPDTQKLFSAERFARMKRGARLINMGRGTILDEDAFVAALNSGDIRGAAIDVATTEPIPPDSPLWTAKNLFITPHTAGVSDRLWRRETEILMELLERWFDNQEMFNVVDVSAGY
jgi:phosphoglycerate dehydrogenase-like enzyme